MNGSEFAFHYVHLIYIKYHKTNLNHGGSYVHSSDLIKKAAINPINKKDTKCFQYAVTVVLNYEKIGKHAGKITTIKTFINKYTWV